MAIFKTIPFIELSVQGPVLAKGAKSKNPQYVHLRQGSLDGACGPYCLFMALIALGFEKHSKLTALSGGDISKNIFKMIYDKSSSLVREGTDINLMINYVKICEHSGIAYEKKCAELHGNCKEAINGKRKNYKAVERFIINHLNLGHPVMVGTNDHYVLGIGLGYDSDENFKNQDPMYLLVLDPDVESPVLSAWNGVFDLKNRNYSLNYEKSVKFVDAIAIWRK